MADKKGIELINTGQANSRVSITIGSSTIKPQGRPITVRFEKEMAHVYLVIDTSGSMANDKLEQAKQGVLDFAKDAFRKEYDVGLISFNSDAKHICGSTFDIRVLKNKVHELNATGTTNMAEGIRIAHNCLRKLSNTRVMVIATDGVPNSATDALKAASSAKKDKIDIITIGTDDADQSFLKKLATRDELGQKVAKAVFSHAIASASNLLPAPKSVVKR